MNKILIKRIHSRLGYWIKYERKRLFEVNNNPRLRQEKFVLLNENEYYDDFKLNQSICSRTTLSRIENGKLVYNKSLITFFLNRFGKSYRINDKEQHLIDSTINAYSVYYFTNCNISIEYLNMILEDTNKKVIDNFLWDEDYKVLRKLLLWFNRFELLSKIEFEAFYSKFTFYHEEIKRVLIYYLCFSCYFDPELWSKNKDLMIIISKEYSDQPLLSIFFDLFSKQEINVIRSFYKYNHNVNEASFLSKVLEAFRIMFNDYSQYKRYPNLFYVNLVHKLKKKNYIVEHAYESCLFSYLEHHEFNENHDINHLLVLIQDEPNPRIINQMVLQSIYPKIKLKLHMSKVLSFLLE